MKQSLVLYQTLTATSQGSDESNAWVDRLMSVALSARLGIANQLAETEVPVQMATAAWKATSAYMTL